MSRQQRGKSVITDGVGPPIKREVHVHGEGVEETNINEPRKGGEQKQLLTKNRHAEQVWAFSISCRARCIGTGRTLQLRHAGPMVQSYPKRSPCLLRKSSITLGISSNGTGPEYDWRLMTAACPVGSAADLRHLRWSYSLSTRKKHCGSEVTARVLVARASVASTGPGTSVHGPSRVGFIWRR